MNLCVYSGLRPVKPENDKFHFLINALGSNSGIHQEDVDLYIRWRPHATS